jgi:hypothetical protein
MLIIKILFSCQKGDQLKTNFMVFSMLLTLISTTFCSCNDVKLPLHSVNDKTGFTSWNIDEIAETKDLLLSKIAEKSEVIIIPSDDIAPVLATNINEIVVSDSLLLLIPRYEANTAPLLFNRRGVFITRRKEISLESHVLNAIIADHANTIYYLIAGIRWFSHQIPDNKITELPQLRGIESLTVLSGNKFVFPSRDIRNWIHSGSLYSPYRLEAPGQSENNLINYMSVPLLIKRDNTVLVQFPLINDTVYLYEPSNQDFQPIFGIFSDSFRIKISSNVTGDPEILVQEAERFYREKKPVRKKIVLYCNGRYLLRVNHSDSAEYMFFEEHTKEAYIAVNLTDDLHGGFSIGLHSLFHYPRNWGFNSNSDHLVYWFTKREVQKKLNDSLISHDNNSEALLSLRRQISECDDNDLIVFINKLK